MQSAEGKRRPRKCGQSIFIRTRYVCVTRTILIFSDQRPYCTLTVTQKNDGSAKFSWDGLCSTNPVPHSITVTVSTNCNRSTYGVWPNLAKLLSSKVYISAHIAIIFTHDHGNRPTGHCTAGCIFTSHSHAFPLHCTVSLALPCIAAQLHFSAKYNR